jgi:arsenate reductase
VWTYDPPMADLTLWHNPRCSKSRQAKDILDAAGTSYREVRYVDEPPTAAELDAVLTALGMEPWEITRMGEDVAKELDLKHRDHDRADWISVLIDNPILIERPIVLSSDGRAVLGRPPENVSSLL